MEIMKLNLIYNNTSISNDAIKRDFYNKNICKNFFNFKNCKINEDIFLSMIYFITNSCINFFYCRYLIIYMNY